MRRLFPMASLAVALLALPVHAAATAPATAAASRPAPDRSTPAAALAAYFSAQQRVDLDAVQALITVSDPEKVQYVQIVLNWMLWAHYLERAAVRKFGPAGLTVLGNLRSEDDQLALDQKRLKSGDIQFATDHLHATVFLTVEPGRPAGLQTDRFFFLDRYVLAKTADGWRIDFLKTYDCADPAKDSLYRFEAGIFPLLATDMKALADKLAAGDFSSAPQLKAAWDADLGDAYSGAAGGK